MRKFGAQLLRDQTGGVLVEATVMIVIMLVFLLGSVDFLLAAYQWNAAAKAVQVGARIAAVSSPVATAVSAITGTEGGVAPGTIPPPSFTTMSCTGTGGGGCSTAAMNTIVFGRGSVACGDATSFYNTGMCDVFPNIQPANVTVSYVYSGLGYAGRPGGPVPTITVELQSLTFRFFFLGGFMQFGDLAIPNMRTTITGEDLNSAAPP
jgi:Flp pilus assembly protein TadG